jgi:uncharacterized protein HemX
MKNLETIIVFVLVLGLGGIAMLGCKGKSDEERLAELKKQLDNAETFEEMEAISKKIEKLGEKVISNTKTTRVALGKPVTYW